MDFLYLLFFSSGICSHPAFLVILKGLDVVVQAGHHVLLLFPHEIVVFIMCVQHCNVDLQCKKY